METTVLITGANGEIGHGLINRLSEVNGAAIVAIDLHPLDDSLRRRCIRTIVGDILNVSILESLSTAHNFDTIYHCSVRVSESCRENSDCENQGIGVVRASYHVRHQQAIF
jgi:FlaA1/EpsC-like NDP-sugar epimerase